MNTGLGDWDDPAQLLVAVLVLVARGMVRLSLEQHPCWRVPGTAAAPQMKGHIWGPLAMLALNYALQQHLIDRDTRTNIAALTATGETLLRRHLQADLAALVLR